MVCAGLDGIKNQIDPGSPLDVDIYDTKVWTKYGWNAINDKRFANEFTPAERRTASAYFAAVLLRAKRLHEALAAVSAPAR